MSKAHDNVVHKLNQLIQLDYDAIEAYVAAIKRLENAHDKEQLSKFCEDHDRHVRVLSALVDSYGGKAATGSDLKRVLTKGKVLVADLVGDDHAILMAMRANEETANRTYDETLTHIGNVRPETRTLLEKHLADERRHRAWISLRLERRKAAA